ncbi:hypothetical protein Sjap_012672 [Stephania japonica]|uniref:Uncharacterized protein n=1 Tax=Stephania japonica TaxID=461633 RepID=A0AAP0NZ56_9MAGN
MGTMIADVTYNGGVVLGADSRTITACIRLSLPHAFNSHSPLHSFHLLFLFICKTFDPELTITAVFVVSDIEIE